ncbi:hypothetical protein [Limnothrix redekei]|uniref:Uncharacterized protein n=1 Tax=Limnothrix redekei LRLZ20PSL1 TaxID=3112953 RepID=A0ABW7CE00_9CYAN
MGDRTSALSFVTEQRELNNENWTTGTGQRELDNGNWTTGIEQILPYSMPTISGFAMNSIGGGLREQSVAS